MAKNWLDQPDQVADLPVLLRFYESGVGIIEFRARTSEPDDVFITAGNLFGSQTVRCNTMLAALQLVDLVLRLKGKTVTLPAGILLLRNSNAATEEAPDA
jgi:hypothetical protein